MTGLLTGFLGRLLFSRNAGVALCWNDTKACLLGRCGVGERLPAVAADARVVAACQDVGGGEADEGDGLGVLLLEDAAGLQLVRLAGFCSHMRQAGQAVAPRQQDVC